MPAVLFGSIGTLADTSELQREAFNEAFREHGLDWNWSRDEYRELLASSGGRQRVADYAQQRGEQVDADAVHTSKSANFQRKLREQHPAPRPGVAETIAAARERGVKVALVTTTSPENIAALTEALAPAVDLAAFDLVLDTSYADAPKPAPDIYRVALQRLGEDAGDVVAIEDNAGGVEAAAQAGLTTIAFPGANNAGHDFDRATERVSELQPSTLAPLAA